MPGYYNAILMPAGRWGVLWFQPVAGCGLRPGDWFATRGWGGAGRFAGFGQWLVVAGAGEIGLLLGAVMPLWAGSAPHAPRWAGCAPQTPAHCRYRFTNSSIRESSFLLGRFFSVFWLANA